MCSAELELDPAELQFIPAANCLLKTCQMAIFCGSSQELTVRQRLEIQCISLEDAIKMKVRPKPHSCQSLSRTFSHSRSHTLPFIWHGSPLHTSPFFAVMKQLSNKKGLLKQKKIHKSLQKVCIPTLFGVLLHVQLTTVSLFLVTCCLFYRLL